MRVHILLLSLPILLVCSTTAYAQNPSNLPVTLQPANNSNTKAKKQSPSTSKTDVSSTYDENRLQALRRSPEVLTNPPLRSSQIDALKRQAQKAVFVVNAYHAPSHRLAESGTHYDGACVAITHCPGSEEVSELNETVDSPQKTKPKSYSHFDRDLASVSSPFAARNKPTTKTATPTAQCYLTTADWLTGAEKIEIIVNNTKVSAEVALRDDRQNIVVLKTLPRQNVSGLEIAPYDAPQSPTAYALLNPGSAYESFSQQSFVITQPHLYGTTSLTARNGYPLINAKGQIVGLTVAPVTTRTHAEVVHYMLIDRAFFPEKYDQTITEKSELKVIQ